MIRTESPLFATHPNNILHIHGNLSSKMRDRLTGPCELDIDLIQHIQDPLPSVQYRPRLFITLDIMLSLRLEFSIDLFIL